MDVFNMNSKCPECGQGGIQTNFGYKPPIINSLYDKDVNFCSNCGDSLYSMCTKCNGTGTYRPFYLNRNNYCSYCGREIEYDETCSSCDGSGKVYDSKHQFYCKPRY